MDNLNDILKDRTIKEVHTEENTILIYLKPKEPPLPKSWEEFCALNPITSNDCFITPNSSIGSANVLKSYATRRKRSDKNLLPNFETAEAVLALCQLIQLRNCYNGDWVPNWQTKPDKYIIYYKNRTIVTTVSWCTPELLYFKTKELCDEFLRNFRPLIEKLKPLYDIKEGGEQ